MQAQQVVDQLRCMCRQVPAYFNDEQREATIQAGRLAGLETVRLLRCAQLSARSHCPLTKPAAAVPRHVS